MQNEMKQNIMKTNCDTPSLRKRYVAPITFFSCVETMCVMDSTSLKIPKTDDPVDDDYDPLIKERDGGQEHEPSYLLW